MSITRVDPEQLFTQVWPGGIPDRDRLIFEGLLPAAQKTVLARLDAVWRAENGEPIKPLAEKLGLGRAGFYKLRRAWREKSLEGVAPNVRRLPRRMAIADDSPERALARRLIIGDGMASRNLDLARRLLEETSAGADAVPTFTQTKLQWAERLIRHERRALAQDGEFLRKNYGRRLIVDLTAVAVLLRGASELAVVAVCLDAASGLVLGSAMGRIETAVELERAAVEEARRFILRRGADRAVDAWPRCDLSLMLPPIQRKPDDDLELREVVGRLDIRLPGSYAYGQDVVQLVGPKMGRLPFAPRRTLAIPKESWSPTRKIVELSPHEANAVWDAEVLRHNEPLLDAIDRASVFKSGVADGRLQATFYALDGFLTSLEAS